MLFFLRRLVLFIAVFVTLALFMRFYFVPVSTPKTGGAPSSLMMALPSSFFKVHETKTGLLLAAWVAQNSRDWDGARANYSALNADFGGDAGTELRLMTLALGSGDFTQAVATAEKIQSQFLSAEDFKGDDETFDLARLLLIAKAIRTNDVDGGQVLLDGLNKGALSSFAKPILEFVFDAAKGEKTVSENTNNLSSLQIIYKALVAEYLGQIDVAQSLFDKVTGRQVTPQTAEMMAAFYMRHGSPEKALTVLRKTRVVFNDDVGLKKTYFTLKDNPESYTPPSSAAHHLKSAPSILAMAFHDFARAMLGERAVDSALLFARMGQYLDPAAPGISMTIGDILSLQNQKLDAIAAYQSVPQSDDDYLVAQIEIADLYRDLERNDEAVSLLEDVIANHPDGRTANMYLAMANMYKADDQFEKAAKTYDLAETAALTEGDGQAPEWMWFLHYFRGVTFDLLDRHAEAEKDLLQALAMRPDNPTLLNYIGYSYANNGHNLDKAYEMISRAIDQSPDDAYIVDSMGWVLYRMGRYDEAVTYLENAANLRPYHAVINDHLGDAYWKVGRTREAHYMWRRAVDYTNVEDAKKRDANEEEQAEAANNARKKLETGLVD